jgi:NAD+ kinase
MTEIGKQCDLGLVIGGDGTMLGIGRQMARFNLPLMGINQGRLGFITDIPLQRYQDVLLPMLQGQHQTEDRSLLQAQVMRDQRCVFSALAMNDVVVNRGGTSGMVELRVEVDGRFVSNQRAPHTLSNRPIVLPESSEISIEIVAGRYVSANFDMQSLADLILGDRIVVKRSEHTVRFLHPAGWNYFDTLRKKMHWNEGA